MVLSATMEELRDAERALGVNGCSESAQPRNGFRPERGDEPVAT